MKKLAAMSFIVVFSLLILSFGENTRPQSLIENATDSLKDERRRYIKEILESIKGKESVTADSVFKNVNTFTGNQSIKATHFLAVMDYWGEALGVSCNGCHNTNDWASDEKNEKNVARGMYNLRQIINKEISINIENEGKIKPLVNCGTCHRGNKIPQQ